MVRFIVISIVVWLVLRVVFRKLFTALGGSRRNAGRISGPPLLVEDPVCKLNIPVHDALSVKESHGTVYFCSPQCRDTYLAL